MFSEFWCDIDWRFCFKQFVEIVKLSRHRGITISVKNYESQAALYCLFRFGENEYAKKILNFPSLRWDSFRWIISAENFNLSDSNMTLLCCHFQYCLVNALANSRYVPGEVHSIVGSKPNTVHVMNTMVSFDIWVQALVHETLKWGYRSVETLCKSFIVKCFASKQW